MQTNFYSGPDFCKDPCFLSCEQGDNLSFMVPNPLVDNSEKVDILDADVSKFSCHSAVGNTVTFEDIVSVERFFSFQKLLCSW